MKEHIQRTGIYCTVNQTFSLNNPDDRATWGEALKEGLRAFNFAWVLDREEERAVAVLADHDIVKPAKLADTSDPAAVAAFIERQSDFTSRCKEAADRPIVGDALDVLEYIHQIRRALAHFADNPGAGMLAVFAYRLGAVAERLAVRWAEPLVQRAERMTRKPDARTLEMVKLIDKARARGKTVDEAIALLKRRKKWRDLEPSSMRGMYYKNR